MEECRKSSGRSARYGRCGRPGPAPRPTAPVRKGGHHALRSCGFRDPRNILAARGERAAGRTVRRPGGGQGLFPQPRGDTPCPGRRFAQARLGSGRRGHHARRGRIEPRDRHQGRRLPAFRLLGRARQRARPLPGRHPGRRVPGRGRLPACGRSDRPQHAAQGRSDRRGQGAGQRGLGQRGLLLLRPGQALGRACGRRPAQPGTRRLRPPSRGARGRGQRGPVRDRGPWSLRRDRGHRGGARAWSGPCSSLPGKGSTSAA